MHTLSTYVPCAHMCVMCVGSTVSALELCFTPINHSVKPTFTMVSASITMLQFLFVLCPIQPEHCLRLQGFRWDHLRSFFSRNIYFFILPFSFSICSHPSKFSFLSQSPSGCSLSKPIVAMHITNKLCSSKGYKAHFCSATHCHSIISCYHDMPP